VKSKDINKRKLAACSTDIACAVITMNPKPNAIDDIAIYVPNLDQCFMLTP